MRSRAAAERAGCKSVAFTYNDPVIFAEYAMDTADACHELGIQAVAVTAGYIGAEARRDFYAKMDAANVDLKGFTDEFYVKLCGARLQPVLDTLVYLQHETERVDRDHDAAHPRQERLATPRSRPSANGSRASSVPTCRCTSPRFIPTTR